jgi:hypothetical protein
MKWIIIFLITCTSTFALSQDYSLCDSIILNTIIQQTDFQLRFEELFPDDKIENSLQEALSNQQVNLSIEGKIPSTEFDNYCSITSDSLLKISLFYRSGLCESIGLGLYVLDIEVWKLYGIWYALDSSGELLTSQFISIVLTDDPILFREDEMDELKNCFGR